MKSVCLDGTTEEQAEDNLDSLHCTALQPSPAADNKEPHHRLTECSAALDNRLRSRDQARWTVPNDGPCLGPLPQQERKIVQRGCIYAIEL